MEAGGLVYTSRSRPYFLGLRSGGWKISVHGDIRLFFLSIVL